VCWSRHLVNVHEVKPVWLINHCCPCVAAILPCLTILYIVLRCVVAIVSRPAWRLLLLLIERYVSNLIYCY